MDVPESTEAPLPPGWEERTTAGGRKFYVDHRGKTTQWQRPSPVSPDEAARIEAEDAERATEAALAAEAAQAAAEAERIRVAEADAAAAAAEAEAAEAAEAARLAAAAAEATPVDLDPFGPLPEGWEEKVYKGRVCFVNHTTKTTQWNDPRLVKSSDGSKPVAGTVSPAYSRDYKRKLAAFRGNLRSPHGAFEFEVSRGWVLQGSMDAILPAKGKHPVTPWSAAAAHARRGKAVRGRGLVDEQPHYQFLGEDMRKRIMMKFKGEAGLDYGGKRFRCHAPGRLDDACSGTCTAGP